uniref:BED-type domain-containing protein n=1 Tax=Cannabis sativa TaxID=3483 RepID=A0A803QAL6_CANSA
MGRTRLPDKAWNYCTMVDGKSCHVCCIFCGHTMWGGVSRLKEHLAQKRGDVAECKRCPANVTMEMQEHLIQVVEEMDEKEKALLDEAIKESLQTHKMEEMKEKNEEADLARACLESVQLYEQELLMRQNGSSSRYDYDETDFDIDMNF